MYVVLLFFYLVKIWFNVKYALIFGLTKVLATINKISLVFSPLQSFQHKLFAFTQLSSWKPLFDCINIGTYYKIFYLLQYNFGVFAGFIF